MVVIVIYLFVLVDSLNSQGFTTRTEQLIDCCESLQRRRVGLGWTRSNFILLIIPRQYLYCGSNCFIFLHWLFVMFASYVQCTFSYFSKFR